MTTDKFSLSAFLINLLQILIWNKLSCKLNVLDIFSVQFFVMICKFMVADKWN